MTNFACEIQKKVKERERCLNIMSLEELMNLQRKTE